MYGFMSGAATFGNSIFNCFFVSFMVCFSELPTSLDLAKFSINRDRSVQISARDTANALVLVLSKQEKITKINCFI